MRPTFAALALFAFSTKAQQSFTLQQILSAPYATSLTAAPTGPLFAWVEDTEGRHNLYVGGANTPARALTHYTEDDAQDIAGLAWSPDASTIAYVYGAEIGNSGRPANPAHLQRSTDVEIYLQPTAGGAPTKLGEGHAPFFTPDGNSILFLRSGQIFIADLHCLSTRNCHPERSEGQAPPAAAQNPSNPSTNVAPRSEPNELERPASPFASAQPATPQDSSSYHPLDPEPWTLNPFLPHLPLYDRGTASSLTLSPDGKTLAYISHRRNHSFLALFDLVTKQLTFPAPSTGRDAAPIFSRDGKHLAWLRYPFTTASEFASNRTSPNPWSIQILDLATHTNRTLFTPEPNQPGSVEPRMSTGEPHLYFSATNQVIFFSEADGWVHLYSSSIDPANTKPPTLLTPNVFEVEDTVLSRDGKEIFFSANGPRQVLMPARVTKTGRAEVRDTPGVYADRRSLFKLDLTQSSPTAGFREQLYEPCCSVYTHPQVTVDGTVAALVSDELNPMHPEIADFAKGSWDTLRTHTLLHPIPLLGSNRVWGPSQPEQVLFNAPDGMPLHGQLFLPPRDSSNKTPTPTKYPAILFFHGGPRRQMLLGYPAMDYYSNAYAMNQYLASRGYIVLSVNYRGGIGYGLNFRQCEHCGADGAAEYADALGAAAFLRSRSDVDAAHIGIWGGSYGGYFVALALARNSDIFAAGVDFHGVHEWAREDNAAADWLRGSLADQEKIAARAHASSPMADIDKWRSPILLIHGDDDPDVAYSQTPILADALRARSVHVEELIFPDELHGFLLHRNWLAAYQAAADFFDRTLKSANGTTPLK